MIPRWESPGDICHDALIVVELAAITVNTMGACEGTEMFQVVLKLFNILYRRTKVHMLINKGA